MDYFPSLLILSLIYLITGANAAVDLQEPLRNTLQSGEETTLDKVKIIGHPVSGRCLVIENKKRMGNTRENQLVLWKCHDRQ